MSRECCKVCLRATSACVCSLFTHVNNKTHVIVLQHPSEVKQSKGTVTLLANSLVNCTVFVGEDFSANEALIKLLAQYEEKVSLLYPSENATVLTGYSDTENIALTLPQCIVLIDATWKKSYKMYMINTFLHDIEHLTLPENIPCDYRIRKTKKAQALSSLEACTHALMLLECDTSNVSEYQNLLTNFGLFNDFQLSFRKNN